MSPIKNLINQLSRLPGIGEKTAERLAYFIIDMDQDRVDSLARAISLAKSEAKFCSVCNDITDQDPCRICSDESRDQSILAIVEEPKDVQSIEKAQTYRGLYYVLHGDIVSSEDSDIKIQKLLDRIEDSGVKELILAFNPDVAGEASTLYLSQLLKPYDIELSRIAYGIPYGGDMDFFDSETISIAISNRTKLD